VVRNHWETWGFVARLTTAGVFHPAMPRTRKAHLESKLLDIESVMWRGRDFVLLTSRELNLTYYMNARNGGRVLSVGTVTRKGAEQEVLCIYFLAPNNTGKSPCKVELHSSMEPGVYIAPTEVCKRQTLLHVMHDALLGMWLPGKCLNLESGPLYDLSDDLHNPGSRAETRTPFG
jgi:hypothetical protein